MTPTRKRHSIKKKRKFKSHNIKIQEKQKYKRRGRRKHKDTRYTCISGETNLLKKEELA